MRQTLAGNFVIPPASHPPRVSPQPYRGHTYAEVAALLDIETWRVQKQVRKALRHIKTHSDRDDACLNPDVLLCLD
ncbi:hypothetical protein QO011_003093 [Labrys wisconsinensis]|uniref:RNA polymerase sigma-70 region 4 domain-containing protein n=1 Tax=Labrys wisconsinensis TaxID=425677 RepID=A0ABU0J731_9HYPH|nr:hypothetical protein [Labrys wisconsinensis]